MRFYLKQHLFDLPRPVRRALFPFVHPRIAKKTKIMHTGFRGPYSFLPFKESKTLFLHIPKVAGVSISEALYGNQSGGHLSLRVLQHTLKIDNLENWQVFAFVRDPWDRVYSGYRFLTTGGMYSGDAELGQEIEKTVDSFDEFVIEWLDEEKLRSVIHFRPQFEFLVNLEGRIELDFLGRFESLSEDYERLRDFLGFGTPLKSLNITQGSKKPLAEVYSVQAAKKVEKLYARDIAEFGYRSPHL
jgi:hypothetical protein